MYLHNMISRNLQHHTTTTTSSKFDSFKDNLITGIISFSIPVIILGVLALVFWLF